MMPPVRGDLPSGTVTFLFTDVEGSTRLLHELGVEGYAEALAVHRRVIRGACTRHDGIEVDTQGDAFFFAFPTAPAAIAAAGEMTAALASGPIQVRVGLHTGTPLLTDEGYVGADVHRAARIAAAGHGGQVIVSKATAECVELDFTDLGEHRFKDLAEPEWLFQLGEEVFPPLKSIAVTNLPTPASTFVGRDRELREVISLVTDGARLVTLTGPGGTGKTRLALEAAWTVAPEYPNGTFWVPMAALRDPELVLETVSQVLGAKDGLESHIGRKTMLLLLDNFEQVVDAAPTLGTLLEACPKLSLLVTSRETLRVSGEREYQVPELSDEEAVSLFCERSQLLASETIAELCRRLDGMPLAIELAAARTKLFSPEQLLERISQRLDLLKAGRDADPRQQTLRATIEWSHDLLSDDEQQLFRQLSVFAGCTYEAAEEVAGADPDTLQSLLDKNLVRLRDGDAAPRFWMLETIREYASERLEESGETAELRGRHGEYFLAVAEAAGSEMWTPRENDALDRIEGDYPNLRAALSSWRDADEIERQLRVTASIWRFWRIRGFIGEGRRWIDPLISAAEGTPGIRHEVLLSAAEMARFQGEFERAAELGREALALARTLDEPVRVGRSLMELGLTFAEQDDVDHADALFEEAELLLSAPGGDRRLEPVLRARLAANRGHLALIQRDYVRAAELSVTAIELNRCVGNDHGVSAALNNLGAANAQLGRHAEAIASFRDALRLFSTRSDTFGIELCLRGIAAVLAFEGTVERAARLLGAAELSHETTGEELGPGERDLEKRTRAVLDAAPQRDRIQAALEKGRSMDLEAATQLALADA